MTEVRLLYRGEKIENLNGFSESLEKLTELAVKVFGNNFLGISFSGFNKVVRENVEYIVLNLSTSPENPVVRKIPEFMEFQQKPLRTGLIPIIFRGPAC